MGIQSDVETRARFGGAGTGDATFQIVVELLRDQPFLEQRLVSLRLLPQGRLPQETDFKGRYVVRVLATERIQSIARRLPTTRDDLTCQLGDPLAKHWDKAAAVEAQEPVDQ